MAKKYMKVHEDECIGCGICEDMCSEEAIEINDDGVAVIDPEKCNLCETCADVCTQEAIELVEEE